MVRLLLAVAAPAPVVPAQAGAVRGQPEHAHDDEDPSAKRDAEEGAAGHRASLVFAVRKTLRCAQGVTDLAAVCQPSQHEKIEGLLLLVLRTGHLVPGHRTRPRAA
jgi:hypothetical protein